MKLKRGIAFILALILGLSLLSGCTKETPVETETPAMTETAAPETKETETAETKAEPESTPAETVAEAEQEYDITVPNFPFRRETFPVMDGSTASVPLGKAIASTLLSETMEEVADLCAFNRTTQSFRNLTAGMCDILVVGEPNAAVFEEMEQEGFQYELEEIATDALIFVVNEENPVENLTTDQIRDIYTGKITNWKEVGGNDAEIIPFQRNEGAGSQALIKKLVMGDVEMMTPPSDYVAGEMGDLMKAVRDYDGSANALGYSVYYYANDMKMAKGLKILSVDGVEPSAQTIRSREYPHLNAYYCVIPKEPVITDETSKLRAEGAKVIYDWLATKGGQNLVASMGYVSVMDTGEGKVNRENLPEDYFTLIDGEEPGELKARSDYGKLIPYAGIPLYENYEGGNSWRAGSYYGFFDENGRIASAPLYPEAEVLTYYDGRKTAEKVLPFYRISEQHPDLPEDEYGAIPAGEVKERLLSMDGSFLSDAYVQITGTVDGVLCFDDFSGEHLWYYDHRGRLQFTEKDLLRANPGLPEQLTEYKFDALTSYGDFYTFALSDGFYILDPATLQILSGPYSWIHDYYKGLFVISDDSGPDSTTAQKGVIDRDFNEVLPLIYDQVEILDDGSIAALSAGRVTVFDHAGNPVATVEGTTDYIYSTAWGFEVMQYHENADTSTKYCDFEGNVLFEDEDGCCMDYRNIPLLTMPAQLSEDGDAVIAGDEGATGVYIYHLLDENGVFVEDVDTVYPFYTMEGTADIDVLTAVKYGYDEDTHDTTYIIPTDLSDMYDAGWNAYATEDEVTGEWYIVTYEDWDSHSFSLYDRNLELVADGLGSGFTVRDGLILQETENAFTAKKPDGTLVFRYSLIKSLGD